MSNQPNYFVSIDSQYRNNNIYPLSTDFGVSFQITDPYATYPDGTFFYPYVLETGSSFNPPNLNPGVFNVTGSGIPYPNGEPVDSTQIFPRTTIDKNWVDNPIQVKGGSIKQIYEIQSSSNSEEYSIIFAGLMTPGLQSVTPFSILVNDELFWSLEYTGSNTGYTKSNFISPYIAKVDYKTQNGVTSFYPGNLIIMDQYSTNYSSNYTQYIDIQISTKLNSIFSTFDFNIPQFALSQVSSTFDATPGITTSFPQLFEKNPPIGFTGSTGSVEVSNLIVIGFDFDLSNFFQYENRPWGYHQYYTSPTPSNVLPSLDGYNQSILDDAGNVFTAVHTNPFDMNFTTAQVPSPLLPIISSDGRTGAFRKSKPLGYTITNSDISFRNVLLCSSGSISSYPPTYSTYITFDDNSSINTNPSSIVPYSSLIGANYGTNSADFFTTRGNYYVALNSYSNGTNGLQIWQISGALGSGSVTSIIGTLSIGTASVAVHSISTQDSGSSTRYISVIYEQPAGQTNLRVYEFNPVGPALTLRATVTNIGTSYDVYMLNNLVSVVTFDSTLQVYTYNPAGPSLTLNWSNYVPPVGTPVAQAQGQTSEVFMYKNIATELYIGIIYDQKVTLYSTVSPSGYLDKSIIDNKSTYSLFFEKQNSSVGPYLPYYLASNRYTSVGNFYNVEFSSSSNPNYYQVGNTFSEGNENLWWGLTSGRIFGFTRDPYNSANNKIYSSQASPFPTSSTKIVSSHTYQTQSSPFNYSFGVTLPNYINYIQPLEYNSNLYLFAVTNNGNVIRSNISNFPIINSINNDTQVFQSATDWTNLNIVYSDSTNSTGTVYIVANNGSTTYWQTLNYDTLLPNSSASIAGTYSWVYKVNNKFYVLNSTTSGGNRIIQIFDLAQFSATPISTVIIGSSVTNTILSGIPLEFSLNNSYCLSLVLDISGIRYVKFVDITNPLSPSLIPGVSFTINVSTSYTPAFVSCSSVTNPFDKTVKLILENQIAANGRSNVFTLILPGDSNSLYLGTFNNAVLVQDSMPYGQSLSSVYSYSKQQQLVSVFDNVVSSLSPTGASNIVSIYNLNIITNEYTRLTEMPVPNFQYSYNGGEMQIMISYENKVLLIICNGAGKQGTQSDTVIIYDVTNSVFAGNNITPTVTSDSQNISNLGSVTISRINADGLPSFNTLLGDVPESVSVVSNPIFDPAFYDSQLVNVTGLEIDTDNLSLYITTDWMTKVGVLDASSSYTGTQRVFRPTAPRLLNNSIIKLETNNGYSDYLVALFGSSSISTVDIKQVSSALYLGQNLEANTTTVYKPQLANDLTNPTIIQSVIQIEVQNNAVVSSFDKNGIFKWYSKIQSPNNTYVIGESLGVTNDSIYLLGSSNSNLIEFYNNKKVKKQNWIENNYNPYLSTGTAPFYQTSEPIAFLSKYSFAGEYLESDFFSCADIPENTTGSNSLIIPEWVSGNSGLNRVIFANNCILFNNPSYFFTRNKDGTLADYSSYTYNYTGSNGDLLDANSILGLSSRYLVNSTYTDQNGVSYSILTLYKDVISNTIVDPFEPYETGTLNLVGRSAYVSATNANYTIRSSSYNDSTNTYAAVLSQKIDTSTITRYFPGYLEYPSKSVIPDVENRYDLNFFYIANIANGSTSSLSNFVVTSPTTVDIYTSNTLDLSQQYYLITSTSTGSQLVIPVLNLVKNANGYYTATVSSTSQLSLSGATLLYMSSFNPNALYTLQFYPAALNKVEYYTVSLENLAIPNRKVINPLIPGSRDLSDYRYIWLEIYNANDNDEPDNEFVNVTFSNNPYRNQRVIFEIPVTASEGGTNYSFYSSSQIPRIKFNPDYYNLRIKLLDPHGNVIEFDPTPTTTTASDSQFTSEVDSSLLNITVNLKFTKYNSY